MTELYINMYIAYIDTVWSAMKLELQELPVKEAQKHLDKLTLQYEMMDGRKMSTLKSMHMLHAINSAKIHLHNVTNAYNELAEELLIHDRFYRRYVESIMSIVDKKYDQR